MTPSGNVYYCRTTNWSSTAVDGGSAAQTVNFTLNPAVTPGNYVLIVSGAGISSFPLFVNITQAEVNGQ
jgi:hydrogenase maturation factor